MVKNFFFERNKIFLFLILFGSFLIFKNFNNGFWADEWATFYFSDPSKLNLILEGDINDGSSKFFYIILIYWNKLFGYHPESIRLFSNIFGIFSILVFFRLSREFRLDNEYLYLTLSLFVTNFFLIHYSVEARWYSLSLFLSLLSIYFFIKCFKKKKYLVFFISASILSTLINIFSIIILLSAFIFVIFYKKKQIIICSSISLLLILILKIDYILIRLLDKGSIAAFSIGSPFTKSFIIGYYFGNFFGNIFFGGLFLLIIFFIILYFRSSIFINFKINFIILITISSYVLPLIYSYLFNPILRDRYILFIVPLIIIFISYFLSSFTNTFLKKTVVYCLIVCTFINIYFHKVYFSKPKIDDALKIVIDSNNKNIFLDITNSHFNTFLFFSKFAKKNDIRFYNTHKNLDLFWTICLNSPRFATSIQIDNEQCFINEFSNTHTLENTIKIPDLVLRNYKKNL
jgi:hypothetical protein